MPYSTQHTTVDCSSLLISYRCFCVQMGNWTSWDDRNEHSFILFLNKNDRIPTVSRNLFWTYVKDRHLPALQLSKGLFHPLDRGIHLLLHYYSISRQGCCTPLEILHWAVNVRCWESARVTHRIKHRSEQLLYFIRARDAITDVNYYSVISHREQCYIRTSHFTKNTTVILNRIPPLVLIEIH